MLFACQEWLRRRVSRVTRSLSLLLAQCLESPSSTRIPGMEHANSYHF